MASCRIGRCFSRHGPCHVGLPRTWTLIYRFGFVLFFLIVSRPGSLPRQRRNQNQALV